MTNKDSTTKLPSEEKILAAYEKLFDAEQGTVRRFEQSGLRYVKFPGGVILVEQNPAKRSQWAKLARAGHQVAWLMQDGKYLARVIDGEVEFLSHE